MITNRVGNVVISSNGTAVFVLGVADNHWFFPSEGSLGEWTVFAGKIKQFCGVEIPDEHKPVRFK